MAAGPLVAANNNNDNNNDDNDKHSNHNTYIYIYTYTYVCTYIYIYIYRERDIYIYIKGRKLFLYTTTLLEAISEAANVLESRQKLLLSRCGVPHFAQPVLGRGDDTVGNPHRAQIYQFEFFELTL